MNDLILKIIENSGLNSFGVRVMSNNPLTGQKIDISIGDKLKNSYQWNDGLTSNDELDGVSALTISYDGFDVEDIEYDLKQLAPYLSLGDEIALIGGTDSYEGNDQDETVITNAEVLYIFN